MFSGKRNEYQWVCTCCEIPGAIVIDNGSAVTKAGYSNADCPRAQFPTVVGETTRVPKYYRDIPLGKTVAGDEAEANCDILRHPIES